MKYTQQKTSFSAQNILIDKIFTESSLFFDIETTGFSPAAASLYLIGCMHRENNWLVIEQFFAETPEEESEILTQFLNLLQSYHTLYSFNGLGFDVPFIKAKCHSLQITEHLDEIRHIDIFKLTSSMKFLLKLPNYKQKTIEQFLGIPRQDRFSGGELIPVYQDYVKTKSPELEHLLLLHNLEDITGMQNLLPILSYYYILKDAYRIQSATPSSFTDYDGITRQELIITLSADYPVPKRISFQKGDFYILFDKDTVKIRIGIFEGELKYFYENYKDYYYLPEEDTAMHKSVAEFVDKAYRQRAKASNCYTRKTGRFLPQYTPVITPDFKMTYKDKLTYFELREDFLNSEERLRKYVEHIFNRIPHLG